MRDPHEISKVGYGNLANLFDPRWLTLKACTSGWTSARDAYNGLANSRFHTRLFGINRVTFG